jgi:head-tail adaptor
MRAGRLDKRVSIRPAAVTNAQGVVATTYPSSTARGARWAERRGLRGAEAFRAQRLDANADYVFLFRSDSVTRAIRPSDRLLIGATSGTPNWYDVRVALDPDGRRRVVQVFAEERHL